MLDWDSLVEARMDAVHVDPEQKSVRIEFTGYWGERPRKIFMLMGGVEELSIGRMKLTNVVDRVVVHGGGAQFIDEKLFKLPRGSEARSGDLI